MKLEFSDVDVFIALRVVLDNEKMHLVRDIHWLEGKERKRHGGSVAYIEELFHHVPVWSFTEKRSV